MEESKNNNKGNHNSNRQPLNNHLNLGQRAADTVAGVVGSWKFLIIQSVILIFWMFLNVVAWAQHWDPYPFILLNLMLSFQAAYAAPIIMMSQNRAAERDRKKSEIDLATDRKAVREIYEIQKRLDGLDKHKLTKILKILENK